MYPYDDSDMKIAGAQPSEKPDSDEAKRTALILEREKQNGNMERAYHLGKQLVTAAAEMEKSLPLEDAALIAQRWLLLTFVVETKLKELLPHPLTAEIAHTVFYNTLTTDAPAFFEELRNNGSLSFYYLCVRDGGDQLEKRVGETFASLCGHQGETEYIEMGKALYCACVGQVAEMVLAQQFVKEEYAPSLED